MTKTIFHSIITTSSSLQVEFFVQDDILRIEWTVYESI